MRHVFSFARSVEVADRTHAARVAEWESDFYKNEIDYNSHPLSSAA